MALANRSLLRKPLLRTLIIFIRLLRPSAEPLLTFRAIAFNMRHRCSLSVLATSLMGPRRLRTAQESHGSHPLRAHVLLKCQSDPATYPWRRAQWLLAALLSGFYPPASLRDSPRLTALCIMPSMAFQLRPIKRDTANVEASFNQSITNASNIAVNPEPVRPWNGYSDHTMRLARHSGSACNQNGLVLTGSQVAPAQHEW